jgi:hypothetical protein
VTGDDAARDGRGGRGQFEKKIRLLDASAGLPDGLFSNQKSQFGKKIFRASDWKMLVYFMAI